MASAIDSHEALLKNIKTHMPELVKMLGVIDMGANSEDYVYRFYHQSYKVYRIQGLTKEIVKLLSKMMPRGGAMHYYFAEIFSKGTGEEWARSHNSKWMEKTRPMLEAFFHAKYFLEMAIKYGNILETAPDRLPSGWAALLYFYGIR